jgi:hypothetical protein
MLEVTDLLLERIEGSVDYMSGADLSLALVGLARLGIRVAGASFLGALPRTVPNMDENHLANSIWALGKIGVAWSSLSPEVKLSMTRAIEKSSGKMTPYAVANTIHGKRLCVAVLYFIRFIRPLK